MGKFSYVIEVQNLTNLNHTSMNTLKREVIQLLKAKPKSLTNRDIRNATFIPAGWLSMLTQERIKSPNVERLKTLINFFNELNAAESKS